MFRWAAPIARRTRFRASLESARRRGRALLAARSSATALPIHARRPKDRYSRLHAPERAASAAPETYAAGTVKVVARATAVQDADAVAQPNDQLMHVRHAFRPALVKAEVHV